MGEQNEILPRDYKAGNSSETFIKKTFESGLNL